MSYKNIISNRFNFEEIRGKVRENLRKIGDSIGGSGGYCGKFKKKGYSQAYYYDSSF